MRIFISFHNFNLTVTINDMSLLNLSKLDLEKSKIRRCYSFSCKIISARNSELCVDFFSSPEIKESLILLILKSHDSCVALSGFKKLKYVKIECCKFFVSDIESLIECNLKYYSKTFENDNWDLHIRNMPNLKILCIDSGDHANLNIEYLESLKSILLRECKVSKIENFDRERKLDGWMDSDDLSPSGIQYYFTNLYFIERDITITIRLLNGDSFTILWNDTTPFKTNNIYNMQNLIYYKIKRKDEYKNRNFILTDKKGVIKQFARERRPVNDTVYLTIK